MTDESKLQFRIKRYGIALFVALTVLAYAFPLLFCVYSDADFTVLANESVAYRYFAVERVREGEGGNIWLPQGQLTTALHRVALGTLDWISKTESLTFRQRLNGFAYLALTINVVLVSLLLLWAARIPSLGFADYASLAVVLLAPIYTARTNGFHYHLFPDYLAVSVILLAVALLIILSEFRRQSAERPSVHTELPIGVVLGGMVANKITLVVPGFLLMLCAVFQRAKSGRRELLIVAGYLMLGAMAAIVVTLLFIYEFNIDSIKEMGPRWFRFVRNPGSEPDFWNRIYEYIQSYFGYAALYATVALGCFVVFVSIGRAWSRYFVAVLLGSLSIYLATALYVARRPAQTTLFEGFCMLLFVSSVLIGTIPREDYRKRIAVIVAITWLVLSAVTFPVGSALSAVSASKAMADERWAMFEQTVDTAAGRRVLVVFPRNEFHHLGVHELILKGAAVFPTWDIDQAGQKLVDRFSPGTRYYHEYNPIGELSRLVNDASVIIWFDRTDIAPLEEAYPVLRELTRSPTSRCDRGQYHDASRFATHVWWRCIRA